jgi:hypothetical protein
VSWEKGVHTVHLDQQLVESVLAFIIASSLELTFAASAPDSVDFIDEDDARCVFARFLEQASHLRRRLVDKRRDWAK